MLLSTSDEIAGREITETIGLVSGNAVRARHLGRDVLAGLKNLVGGEIGAYQKLLSDSRQIAIERMEEQATEAGADAIVAVRLATSTITSGASEVLAYGTAVKLGSARVG